MSHILVVVGSARKGRVADKIVEYVAQDITARDGVTMTLADLKEINMPFFDNELSPNSDDYTITDPQVQAWSEMVQAADSVVFVTPEYNHSLSAIQKNAIDSLGREWNDKPVAVVAYGWSGGSLAVGALREVMGNVKADVKPTAAQLGFMQDLNPDGTLLNEASVREQIATAIDEIA